MNQTQRAVIALLVCLVVWCGWQSKLSSQHSSPATESQSAEERSNESRQGKPDERLWDWLTRDAGGFFTVWLVLVGGAQLALFYVQLRIIRESLDDAKKAADTAERAADASKASLELSRTTAERELRAYVHINKFIFTKIGDGGPKYVALKVTPIWKNSGQTPTRHMLNHISWKAFGGDCKAGTYGIEDVRLDTRGKRNRADEECNNN